MNSIRRMFARALGRDASPLPLHSDRAEARTVITLVILLLAAGLIAARIADQAGLRAEHAARSWRPASVTVAGSDGGAAARHGGGRPAPG